MKMNIMGAQVVLAVLLLAIGSVEAADGDVSFWKTDFTMTCPGDKDWKWFKNGLEMNVTCKTSQACTFAYGPETKGVYHCQYKNNVDEEEEQPVTETYYFYVQGKACENCYELDGFLLAVAIIADLILTAFVMMTVYQCTKMKSPPAPVPQPSKATTRSSRAPNAASSSAYESLTPQSRGEDTYSQINRKK